MSIKELRLAITYQETMNRKFDWTNNEYKLLKVKATKKGITFFCWFDKDEVVEVMVNKYACDAYDVTDIWRTLIWK